MVRTMVALLLALLASAAAAPAAETVLGSGFARGCFEAADQRRTPRDALRLCDSALLDPTLDAEQRAATFVNRGIVQMRAKNLEAALADYDAAIQTRPETAEAYVNKGIALLNAGGREAEAVAALTAGIEREPVRPEIAYYARAEANETLGRIRDAYEDYSRAAQLAPDWRDPAEQLQRFQLIRRKTAGV